MYLNTVDRPLQSRAISAFDFEAITAPGHHGVGTTWRIRVDLTHQPVVAVFVQSRQHVQGVLPPPIDEEIARRSRVRIRGRK